MRNTQIKKEMKKILLLLLSFTTLFSENETAPVNFLINYEGDFTDSDGDGMTDVYELKYGYNPHDSSSFPQNDFLTELDFIDSSSEVGSDENKIYFKFKNFNDEQTTQYIDFIKRLIPIFLDVVGNPKETFVTTIEMQPDGQGSWATFDHGRLIKIDPNWNPRLFTHEMIHMWDGKYGFVYSDPRRAYNDKLSGFCEVAEGVAYKILQKFVEAYPTHSVSSIVANGGAWNNWSHNASGYDVQKHNSILQGGDLWSDDATTSDRYGIVAMAVLNFMAHDENFFKNTRNAHTDIILSDSSKILNRDDIVHLWETALPKVNGVAMGDYVNSIPSFDGKQLEQRFYPHIRFQNTTGHETPRIYALYPVGGYTWWWGVMYDEIDSHNIPSFINYTEYDNYCYVDTGSMPFNLSVNNIFDETIKNYSSETYVEYDDVGDPLYLGNRDVQEGFLPIDFEQGLYSYNLKFTELTGKTEYDSEKFYFMGNKNFHQTELQHSFFIGIDSKFAESVSVEFKSHTFNAPVINGCAIVRTDKLAVNSFGVLKIKVSSFLETNEYERALVFSGDRMGNLHHQFLIVDADFDGVEDLYDSNVNLNDITNKYNEYISRFPEHRTSDEKINWELSGYDSDGNEQDTFELSNLEFKREGDKIIMSFSNTEEYYFDCTSGVSYDGNEININFEFEFHTTNGEKVSFSLSENGLNGDEVLQVGGFTTWGWGETGGYLGISDLHQVDLTLITDEFTNVSDEQEETETSETDYIIVYEETEEETETSETDYINVYEETEENATQDFVIDVMCEWSNATDYGNGWKHTDWFGFFFESPVIKEWKYHVTLGWVYIPGDSFENIWMYSDKFGWLWTKKDFFPYVYMRFNGWIYVEDTRYYDFQEKKYVSF